jgi:hypothetical protein
VNITYLRSEFTTTVEPAAFLLPSKPFFGFLYSRKINHFLQRPRGWVLRPWVRVLLVRRRHRSRRDGRLGTLCAHVGPTESDCLFFNDGDVTHIHREPTNPGHISRAADLNLFLGKIRAHGHWRADLPQIVRVTNTIILDRRGESHEIPGAAEKKSAQVSGETELF